MRVEKNGISKEVDDSLVPDYISAGWKKVQNRFNNTSSKSRNEDKEDKEDLDSKLQGK